MCCGPARYMWYGALDDVKLRSTVTSTPPSASMMRANPAKSMTIVWSIRTPVNVSTMRTISGAPPQAKAALIFEWTMGASLFVDRGTASQVSRGIEMS